MSNFDKKVGENIRAIREARGMSQRQVGEALTIPVTLQQIQKYEKGSNRISAQTLHELSLVFKCPIATLLDGIDIPSDIKLLDSIITKDTDRIKDKDVRAAVENLIDVIAQKRILLIHKGNV
jgi:transcriptional regulator with XRE-family HTH domain